MNFVPYDITKASNTGKYGQTSDNVKETDTSTVWEVDADTVSLDISFDPCVLAKIAVTIKSSVTITVELKGRDRVLHKECREEELEKELKTAVFEFNSGEKAAKASFRFVRLRNQQPIRVVSVVLLPRKDGEIAPAAGPCTAALPATPLKRALSSPSPQPEKRPAVATYVLGDLAGSPMRKSPSRLSRHLTEHTKLKAQPVTQPYSQALLGVSIAAYADSLITDVIKGLAGVMGATYREYAEKGVDFLVVDERKRDRKVVERAEKQGIKVGALAWLLGCRDANEQISYRDYLVS